MYFILDFFILVLLHIINDFNLQGIMADLKQKDSWHDMPAKYDNDYKMALFEHAFSWTCFIMSPWIICQSISLLWLCLFVVNLVIHCIVDDLKANKLIINLVEDQCIHLLQLLATLAILGTFWYK